MYLWAKLKSGYDWSWSLRDSSLENLLWHVRLLLKISGISMDNEFTHQEIYYPAFIFIILFYFPIFGFGEAYATYLTVGAEKIDAECCLTLFFPMFYKWFWILAHRDDILQLFQTAKLQNRGLTAIEEGAIHEELKLAKWRCRTYFLIMDTNTLLFVYNFMLRGLSSVPYMPVMVPGFEDTNALSSIVLYNILRSSLILVCLFELMTFPSIFVVLVGHAASHAKAIAAELKSLKELVKEDRSNVTTKIIYLLKRHQNLVVFVKKLDELFSIISGIDIPFYAISIAVSLQEPSESTVGYFVYALLSFLVICFFGEYLTSSGDDIVESIYDCDWQEMTPEDRKLLRFMLEAAQKSLKLTTFKIFILSYDTYKKFLKLIYRTVTFLCRSLSRF